jgi:hypothetical protein
MTFITRAYNDISLDSDTGVLVKTSTDKKLEQEAAYYGQIPDSLKTYFPKYLGHDTKDGKTLLSLEYFPSTNLGRLFMDATTSSSLWESIVDSVATAQKQFALHRKKSPEAQIYRSSMFIDKTEREVFKLYQNFEFFKNIGTSSSWKINGKTYPSYQEFWPAARQQLEGLCTSEDLSIIHGDFCFSNILYNADHASLKFVDPRGAFGESGCYGDSLYDIAKLVHSFEGLYELIIYDDFSLKPITNGANVGFAFGRVNTSARDIFVEYLRNNFDLDSARLIAGTIFLGMCARHYDNLERQVVMYATGVRMVCEALEACM